MITATGLDAIKMMRYFPIVLKRFRAPICLHFAAVFWRAGVRESSHEAFWGGGDGGGVRRVKSHLEARDGAEFHEQHLEFQLHHVGQTHSGTWQWRAGGWESVWMWLISCFFLLHQCHNKKTFKENILLSFSSLSFIVYLYLCMTFSSFKPIHWPAQARHLAVGHYLMFSVLPSWFCRVKKRIASA